MHHSEKWTRSPPRERPVDATLDLVGARARAWDRLQNRYQTFRASLDARATMRSTFGCYDGFSRGRDRAYRRLSNHHPYYDAARHAYATAHHAYNHAASHCNAAICLNKSSTERGADTISVIIIITAVIIATITITSATPSAIVIATIINDDMFKVAKTTHFNLIIITTNSIIIIVTIVVNITTIANIIVTIIISFIIIIITAIINHHLHHRHR
jgi:hypothetical protein